MPRLAAVVFAVLSAWFVSGRADAGSLYTVTDFGATIPVGLNDKGDVGLTAGVYHSYGPEAGQVTPWGTPGTPDETAMRMMTFGPSFTPVGDANIVAEVWNHSGQIAGAYYMENPPRHAPHAFIDQGGTLVDLGTLGGRQSVIGGINDFGQVVGGAGIPGDGAEHAFLYSGGAMHDLGTLRGYSYSLSFAHGINNAGQVVGDSDGVAVIWQSGKITDLNTLLRSAGGLSLVDAYAVNNLGQILATGTNAAGVVHAVLLTPANLPPPAAVTPVPDPVPEPAAGVVFGMAFLGYALHRRRRGASQSGR